MADDFLFDTAGVSTLADEVLVGAGSAEFLVTPTAVRENLTVRSAPTRSRSKSSGPLYLDLETIPDYSRLHLFDLPSLPEIPFAVPMESMPSPSSVVSGTVDDTKKALRKIGVCPGEWLDIVETLEQSGKNRAGVLDAIKEARNARQAIIDQHLDRRKLLSTTPEYCQIAAVGWAVGNAPAMSNVLGLMPNGDPDFDVISEKYLLNRIWQLIADHSPLVIFNGLHFDLPVIFVRSMLLGVAPSKSLDLKPWGKDVVDPYAIRFAGKGGGNDGRPRKLKSLAPLYGIDVPAGDCDGSQVEELMKSDPAKVGEYVRSDIEVLRAYHRTGAGFFWA